MKRVCHPNSLQDDNEQPSRKRRKRVTILEQPSQVVEGPKDIDLQNWYSGAEMNCSLAISKMLCRIVDTDDLLLQAYHLMCQTANEAQLLDELDPIMSSVVTMLLSSDDFICQRGLERLSLRHNVARKMQTFGARSAVLLEQSQQNLNGQKDAERIATIAKQASCPSQRFSRMLGMADAITAYKIYSLPPTEGGDEDGLQRHNADRYKVNQDSMQIAVTPSNNYL